MSVVCLCVFSGTRRVRVLHRLMAAHSCAPGKEAFSAAFKRGWPGGNAACRTDRIELIWNLELWHGLLLRLSQYRLKDIFIL